MVSTAAKGRYTGAGRWETRYGGLWDVSERDMKAYPIDQSARMTEAQADSGRRSPSRTTRPIGMSEVHARIKRLAGSRVGI